MKTFIMKSTVAILLIIIIILIITGLLRILFVIHQYLGLAFGAIILIHLLINWSWLKANFLTKKDTAPTTNPK